MGVPIKLLHEGEGHAVSVEMKNGELYRGRMLAAEDNMNLQLSGVVHTSRDMQITRLEHVFLRGSQIRYIVLPDMLKEAPVFKKVQAAKAKAKPFTPAGRGRGKGVKK